MTRLTNDWLKNLSIMLWGVSGIHVSAWRPSVRSTLAYRGVKARRGLSLSCNMEMIGSSNSC